MATFRYFALLCLLLGPTPRLARQLQNTVEEDPLDDALPDCSKNKADCEQWYKRHGATGKIPPFTVEGPAQDEAKEPKWLTAKFLANLPSGVMEEPAAPTTEPDVMSAGRKMQ